MTYGAIEAGGTKFRAALLDNDLAIVDEMRVATTTPDETIGPLIEFLRAGRPRSIGIASFGPLDLDRHSARYGSIVSTPKPGWSGTPLLQRVADGVGVPADIQTDVEAAAVAEWARGAGQGHARVAYITIGTGIGAAWATDGAPYRGQTHTELGHIPVTRIVGDSYPGNCPFHGDCLEGMASGTAMADRWGSSGEDLTDPQAWELEAAYLAQLCRTFTYSAAPSVIIFGGGVTQREGLIDEIRTATTRSINQYTVVALAMESYIQAASLGQEAGLIGAGLLARSL